MTTQSPNTNILGVDFKPAQNNPLHHTGALSKHLLIVRRGQSFSMHIQFNHPFISGLHKLIFTVTTGLYPGEDIGTKCVFGLPDLVNRSAKAKAIWSVVMDTRMSYLEMGNLHLTVTPPANAPVGKYLLFLDEAGEQKELGSLVVLFNPWCPTDWVYMPEEADRQEYVMNTHGIIYKGTGNYITSMAWDFAQFEEKMVQICLMLLDLSHKHLKDPADDVSARCNPIYVSRIISAMINSEDDRGVLMGRWGDNFTGGTPPSHWSGSYPILLRWLTINCYPVKFGQCWVFGGVMCSVMRFFGIPCRVITNYQSAHDNDRNLLIDVYHPDYGVRDMPSKDSVWNYHVWVEGWMKRPDLRPGYDGWQVLDPTPQERSEGVFWCGPAPVKAVLNGDTDLKYNVPFVFAEVNADCVDWLVKRDGSKVKIFSDSKRVGQNISTKSVGSDKRLNITSNYKHAEGSEEERAVFTYALTRDYSKVDKEEEDEEEESQEPTPDRQTPSERSTTTVNGGGLNGPLVNGTGHGSSSSIVENGRDNITVCPPPLPPRPQITMKFQEVSKPLNGEDVKVNLVLHSDGLVPRILAVNVSVIAMSYNGSPLSTIQSELKEGDSATRRRYSKRRRRDLIIPAVVSFSEYWQPMLNSDVMKISAVVSDTNAPDQVFLAETDLVLIDPPLEIKLLNEPRVFREVVLQVSFVNPVGETLKDCSLTLSGSGLWREEQHVSLPEISPKSKVIVNVCFYPYQSGVKTLVADFDCSMFRDIKSTLGIPVKDSIFFRF
ncbi:protein-glutamine gamma-glutamyltransferase E [Boleophthalmus pectinirostris]|uniref:protein-glutamine gamma-glutamyltransferase E n=1 Tax=Boleophthalmus pectinirostris TaxID=150288 RepID=UPI00242C3342|nr:protein-glutamine gamma-glutamyltransferase E [Boleophthalmus pectinirostris]